MLSLFKQFIIYKKSKMIVEDFEALYNSDTIAAITEFIDEEFTSLEKEIYNRYYFSNRSLKEVAKDMNFSYSHIQGTHMKLKSKLIIALKSAYNQINQEDYETFLKLLDNLE